MKRAQAAAGAGHAGGTPATEGTRHGVPAPAALASPRLARRRPMNSSAAWTATTTAPLAGAPADVTLSEPVIELFHPLDEFTTATLRVLGGLRGAVRTAS
ncbi:hypothetical protein ACFU5O_06610 [Streptomyces sp. NPDC057445]|uniref:hypothetical protein n=1 Tax=Streptomyces sp. NPDC057445 TaxID=3346136 RepID=UPI0036849914